MTDIQPYGTYEPSGLVAAITRRTNRIPAESWYGRRLAGSLKYRPVTMLIVVGLIGVTGFMFTKTSSELAPAEDSGALFSVINAPRYATTPYTKLYADQMFELTKDLPLPPGMKLPF